MPQDTIHNSTPVKQVAAEVRKRQCAGAQEHLEKVAQFIATFEADIVNLVEVEGCSNLEALVVDGGAAALRGSYTGYVRQGTCLLYTSPSPRDRTRSRMPSSA